MWFLLSALVLGGATTAVAAVKQRPPIRIRSKQATLSGKTGAPNQFVLEGGVDVRQGHIAVKGDKLTAHLHSKTREVNKAVVTGRVRIRSGDRLGTARQAVFDRIRGTVTLTGSPRLWEGGNLAEGRRIVFFLDSSKVDCQRCELVLDPKEFGESVKSVKPSQSEQ